jgi:hypothetical protein
MLYYGFNILQKLVAQRMKFRLLSEENESEEGREFISEGQFHFIKKPLPPSENSEKRSFNFIWRKRTRK